MSLLVTPTNDTAKSSNPVCGCHWGASAQAAVVVLVLYTLPPPTIHAVPDQSTVMWVGLVQVTSPIFVNVNVGGQKLQSSAGSPVT